MFRLVQFTTRAARAIALATLVAAIAWGAENTKKPISRERLFRAIEIGGLSNDEFVQIVKDFGVEFQLSDQDRQELAKAGVSDVVVSAIADNFRDPVKERLAQISGGPLSKDNITGLLKAGAGSDVVEMLIEKRGVTFAMTPADAKEIESAGGNKVLLGALLLKEPVKVAAKEQAPAKPEPAKLDTAKPESSKEPVLVAAATPAATIVPQAQTAAPAPTPAQAPAQTTAAKPAAPANNPAPAQGVSLGAAPSAATPSTPAPPAQAQQAPAAATPVNQAAALLTSSAKPAKLIRGEVRYTEMARRVHATGKVIMEIVINEQGKVENIKGISGNPLLIVAATQSLRDWVYEPATLDGKPMRVSTQVSVNFQ